MKIRKFDPDSDPGRIEALDRICFFYDAPLSREDIIEAFWWLVWDDEGDAVGFAGLKLLDDDMAYLCRVGVLPGARGKGLQKRLLRARERFARECGWTNAITYTAITNPASSNSLISAGYKLYLPEYAWAGKDVLYWIKKL